MQWCTAWCIYLYTPAATATIYVVQQYSWMLHQPGSDAPLKVVHVALPLDVKWCSESSCMVPESCMLLRNSWQLCLKVGSGSVVNLGILWRLYMVQHYAAQLRRHTGQVEVMRNVHALKQNNTIQIILWVNTHKVMVCFTITLTAAVLE